MCKKIILLLLCLIISSCVLNPEPARPELNPIVEFKNGSANKQGVIAINALDDRESTIIGHRFLETMSAPIEIDDLAPVLKKGFAAMAKYHGYTLANKSAKALRSINARLLVFRSTYLPELPAGHYQIDVAVEVVAKNEKANFTNIYRISQKVTLTLGGDSDTQLQNDLTKVFSILLSQIAHDNKLWNFIAKK
jgi:uncharacterized lipoprotein YajG